MNKRGPLTWSHLLQVDSGLEFMSEITQVFKKHNVLVRRATARNHCEQGIVKRFNSILAERLFGAQYAQQMLVAAHGFSERSAEWVKSVPSVLVAFNNETTRLLGMKPKKAIKAVKPSQPFLFVCGSFLFYHLGIDILMANIIKHNTSTDSFSPHLNYPTDFTA